MRQFSMVAKMPPVAMLPAAADAAGRSSSFYSLKGVGKAFVLAMIDQSNAAPVTVSLLQSQGVGAGTNTKAIAATPIHLNNDTSTSDAFVTETSAASFTTDATLKNKLVLFSIEAEAALDVNNGYTAIGISTGASNAGNVTAALLFVLHDYESIPAATSALSN